MFRDNIWSKSLSVSQPTGTSESKNSIANKTRAENILHKDQQQETYGERSREDELILAKKREHYQVLGTQHQEDLSFSSEQLYLTKLQNIADSIVTALPLPVAAKVKTYFVRESSINAYVFTDRQLKDYPLIAEKNLEIPIFINTGLVYNLSEHYRKKRQKLISQILEGSNLDFQRLSLADSEDDLEVLLLELGVDQTINLTQKTELFAIYDNDRYFLSEDKIAAVLSHELTHLTQSFRKNYHSSQEMEYRADIMGQKVLDKAGYAPESMEETMIFLEYLQGEAGFNPCSSHPSAHLRRKECQLAYHDLRNVVRHSGQKQKRLPTMNEQFRDNEVYHFDYLRDQVTRAHNTEEIASLLEQVKSVDDLAAVLHPLRLRVDYTLARKEALQDKSSLNNLLQMLMRQQYDLKNLRNNLPLPLLRESLAEFIIERKEKTDDQIIVNFLEKPGVSQLLYAYYQGEKSSTNKNGGNIEFSLEQIFTNQPELINELQQLLPQQYKQIKRFVNYFINHQTTPWHKDGKQIYTLSYLAEWSLDIDKSLAKYRQPSPADNLLLADLITESGIKPANLLPLSSDELTNGYYSKLQSNLTYLNDEGKRYKDYIPIGDEILAGPNIQEDDINFIANLSIDDLCTIPLSEEIANRIPLLSKFLQRIIEQYQNYQKSLEFSEQEDIKNHLRTTKDHDLYPMTFNYNRPYQFSLASGVEIKKLLLDILTKKYGFDFCSSDYRLKPRQLYEGSKKIPILRKCMEVGTTLIEQETREYQDLPRYPELLNIFSKMAINIFDHDAPQTESVKDYFQSFWSSPEIHSLTSADRVRITKYLTSLIGCVKKCWVDFDHGAERNKFVHYDYTSHNDGYEYYHLSDVVFSDKGFDGYLALSDLEDLILFGKKHLDKTACGHLSSNYGQIYKNNIDTFRSDLVKESVNSEQNTLEYWQQKILTSYLGALECLNYLDQNPQLLTTEQFTILVEQILLKHYLSPAEKVIGLTGLTKKIIHLKRLPPAQRFAIFEKNYPETTSQELTQYFHEWCASKEWLGEIEQDPRQAAEQYYYYLLSTGNALKILKTHDKDESKLTLWQKTNADLSATIQLSISRLFFANQFTEGSGEQSRQKFIQRLWELNGLTSTPNEALSRSQEQLTSAVNNHLFDQSNKQDEKIDFSAQQLDQFVFALLSTSNQPIDSYLFNCPQYDLSLLMSEQTQELYYKKLLVYYQTASGEVERNARRQEIGRQLDRLMAKRLFLNLDQASAGQHYWQWQLNNYLFTQVNDPDREYQEDNFLMTNKNINQMRAEGVDTYALAEYSALFHSNQQQQTKLAAAAEQCLDLINDKQRKNKDKSKNYQLERIINIIKSVRDYPNSLSFTELAPTDTVQWQGLQQELDKLIADLGSINNEIRKGDNAYYSIGNLHDALYGWRENIKSQRKYFQRLVEFYREPVLDERVVKQQIMTAEYNQRKAQLPEEIVAGFTNKKILYLLNEQQIKDFYALLPVEQRKGTRFDDLMAQENSIYSVKYLLQQSSYRDVPASPAFMECVRNNSHLIDWSSVDQYQLAVLLDRVYGLYGELNTIPPCLQKVFGPDWNKGEAIKFVSSITPEQVLSSLQSVMCDQQGGAWQGSASINRIYLLLQQAGLDVSERPGSEAKDLRDEKSSVVKIAGGNNNFQFTAEKKENYLKNKDQYLDYADLEINSVQGRNKNNVYALRYYYEQMQAAYQRSVAGEINNNWPSGIEEMNNILLERNDLKDLVLLNYYQRAVCHYTAVKPIINSFDVRENQLQYVKTIANDKDNIDKMNELVETIFVFKQYEKVDIPWSEIKIDQLSDEQLEQMEKIGQSAKDNLRSSGPAFIFQLGNFLFRSWESRHSSEQLADMFSQSIARLERYLPVPSYSRNDLLDKIAMRSFITSEQKEKIEELYYSRERQESNLAARDQNKELGIWAGEEKIEELRANLRKLSREEKSQYILWLLSPRGAMPDDLVQSGIALQCKFDSIKKVFYSQSRSVQNNLLADLTMSGSGVFEITKQNDAESTKARDELLNGLYDQILRDYQIKIKPKADKKLYRDIFVNIFRGYAEVKDAFNPDPIRDHELLFNLMHQMSKDQSTNMTLPDFIAIFLQQCGTVGAKIAQVLSESDMVQDQALKNRMREFKENAGDFSKIAALSVVENNKLFHNSAEQVNSIKALGPLIASASVKAAFQVELNDENSSAKVAKILNYEARKREKEDLAVMKYLGAKVPELNLPKHLVDAIGTVCAKERNFITEYENQKMLSSSITARSPERQYVRVVVADFVSPDLMIEEKVPGLSLSDIEIIKQAKDSSVQKENQRLATRQAHIWHRVRRLYNINQQAAEELIAKVNISEIYNYLAKEAATELKEGIFHADLHTGNIFIDIQALTNDNIERLVKAGQTPLNLIDCGSICRHLDFPLDEFVISIYTKRTNVLATKLLKSFLDPNSEQKKTWQTKDGLQKESTKLNKILTQALSSSTLISEQIKSMLWALSNNGYQLNTDFEYAFKGLATAYPVIESTFSKEIFANASIKDKAHLASQYFINYIKDSLRKK